LIDTRAQRSLLADMYYLISENLEGLDNTCHVSGIDTLDSFLSTSQHGRLLHTSLVELEFGDTPFFVPYWSAMDLVDEFSVESF
jgi:hypothetical protein